MTAAWYTPRWWLLEDENYTCTAKERESVLPTSLAFLHFEFLKDLNLTTTMGIVNQPTKEHNIICDFNFCACRLGLSTLRKKRDTYTKSHLI